MAAWWVTVTANSSASTVLAADRSYMRNAGERRVRSFPGAAGLPRAPRRRPAGQALPRTVPRLDQRHQHVERAPAELVGRDEELNGILSLAAAHRLVSLTGAGGISKTRLALAVARQLLLRFADRVWVTVRPGTARRRLA
jgi:hypothetical protein